MREGNSVQDQLVVSDDDVRDAVRSALHTAINVERQTTRAKVAADSGVNIHTIDAWLSRNVEKRRPISFAQALSVMHALGPRAVNSLLALIGYSGARLEGEDELQPMQIVADALGHLGTIGQAAADGRIDHTEEPGTTVAADMLIATVLPLSSAGRR